jgi:hypothetical protein
MMIQALAFNKMSNEEGSCSRNHAAAAERLSPNSISNAGTVLPESTRSAPATAKASRKPTMLVSRAAL